MKNNSLGIVSKPQLGGDIEAYCGKCKEVREHVIAALSSNGAVERVQCRTCQSNHTYRERQAKTATARTASGTTRTPKTAKKESLLTAEPTGPLRLYSTREKFAIGDRIEHPKFGLGVVTDVRLGKIDVKFGKDLRILIHAG